MKKVILVKPILPGSRQINALIFFSFIIVTVILYSGDLHLGFFAVDDPGYITQNPWIKKISSENINHILGNPYFANYSPMHLFSYMLDYSVGGSDAYGFHLSSNIWAGFVAGFVFLIALALTQNKIVSVASGLLFVFHPVHVEAVAWISSRKDLVAAAFALPSFLFYLKYRNKKNKWWYLLSVLLFLFAIAGKLSVATFPAVFLAHDLFIEKRDLRNSILDKIPFLVSALIIGLVAASAQPSMGHRPEPFVLSAALVQNFWLLSGFATYVLYRMPPETSQILFQIGGVIFLIAIFVVPFFLRKKLPVITLLLYWIVFAFIPAQVLSFTHPVTDRYVFFPSIAGAILVAWILFSLIKKIPKYQAIIFSGVIVLISFLWVKNSLNYLNEWKDPRSVWYAAEKKSSDPTIPQNLGSYYVDLSRKFGATPQGDSLSSEQKKHIASLIWQNDPRLPKLISEWESGQKGGAVEKEFQEQIRTLAMDAFDRALQKKGDRVMSAIYYNRASILLDRGELEAAKKEFFATLNELTRDSFTETKEQLTVYSYFGLGLVEYKSGNSTGMKQWFYKADSVQKQAGKIWIPNLNK